MDFNNQGRRISSNAQLLLMSMRVPDRPKFDTVELDKIALSKPANDAPVFQQKRGRGRPRKNSIEQQSKPIMDSPLLQQKRGRGRPRKNSIEQQSKPIMDSPLLQEKRGRGRPRKTVELEIKTKLKENYIVDIKEKLKLLETITNGYKEIERIDKETQKNLEKLCCIIHNSK